MELEELKVMTEDEVECYIDDCVRVLMVLRDQTSPVFEKVKKAFIGDMDNLLELGRITPDEYNEVTSDDNLKF